MPEIQNYTRPSLYRDLPRLAPSRLINWTLPRRFYETMAVMKQASLVEAFKNAGARIENDKGPGYDHTAVTTKQQELILAAVEASNQMTDPIVEIGSWRGITTRAMALKTTRTIYAVDPFIGEGGHERDLRYFEQHTSELPNVTLLRDASDPAFHAWNRGPISMVFIDAIHEYLHALFDFAAWGSLIKPGGFAAFHDVNAFPGVNLVIQKILREQPEWKPWALVPDLAIFQRQ